MRSQLRQSAPRSIYEEVISGPPSGEFGSWSGLSPSPRLTVGIRAKKLSVRATGRPISVLRKTSVCRRAQAWVTQAIAVPSQARKQGHYLTQLADNAEPPCFGSRPYKSTVNPTLNRPSSEGQYPQLAVLAPQSRKSGRHRTPGRAVCRQVASACSPDPIVLEIRWTHGGGDWHIGRLGRGSGGCWWFLLVGVAPRLKTCPSRQQRGEA